MRLPPAGFAVVVRRPRDSAGAPAVVALLGVLAEAIFFAGVPLTVARKHTLGRLEFAELAGELLALRIDARERLAEPLLLLGDLGSSSRCPRLVNM